MKKQKTYPSVNAMLRGTMPRRKADAMIDGISDLQTHQNLDLLTALSKLVDACTANSPSGVTCPDRRVVARARRVAKTHGAIFGRSNGSDHPRENMSNDKHSSAAPALGVAVGSAFWADKGDAVRFRIGKRTKAGRVVASDLGEVTVYCRRRGGHYRVKRTELIKRHIKPNIPSEPRR